GIANEDIYKIDETGFAMDILGTAEVVIQSICQGRPFLVQPGNCEWITSIVYQHCWMGTTSTFSIESKDTFSSLVRRKSTIFLENCYIIEWMDNTRDWQSLAQRSLHCIHKRKTL
ncbi:hypothetical protein ASPTUDRAFT_137468, partial [Aspergillus tubingensis CBS 134.48]